jgi:uncharacterized protein
MSESSLSISETALSKERALIAWLQERRTVLLGFSGGVDSAYLAVVAREALGRERVLAVIGRSASFPSSQWEGARTLAAQFDIAVLEVDTDELNDPRYAANPTNRCYFCKNELWLRLTPVAEARGFDCVVDGTNADDLRDHRPGARAAKEQGVESPLAAVGMTKAEIRERSKARAMPTWNQPSSPCLASRVPYGTAVTPERLAMIDRAEASLRALGVRGDLRVRHFGEMARVEIAAGELAHWTTGEPRAQLEAAVRAAGYAQVELDPRGFRSGALNVLAGVA